MLLLAALVFALAGCGDDEDGGCPEPVYDGDASDEAWRTMVDGDDLAEVGDANAPVLTTPAEDADVSAVDDGLTISWDSAIARVQPPADRGMSPPPAAPGWFDDVRELFEGTAWAHLPPVTGDIYWVRIRVPGRECVVEGLTTELSWEVTGAAWDAVRAATGQSVTIDVTSAYLTENRITEGPYRAAEPRAVTIVP
jgi:hypothetical protein